MSRIESAYIGRFAPSPTGPMHFGSLVAAAGSFFDARANGGRWLLRIEDVDTPRTVPSAADSILAALERLGFHWDEEPVWQSRRRDAYAAAFERLRDAGQVFACACTRREIADSALARDGSRVYPGTCRNGVPPGRTARAWRARVSGEIRFDDAIQGEQYEDMVADVGDFIVLRADGLFAYQLAVVVDDADSGVTHVVRGADLLDSTCRQIQLQHLLSYPVPAYAHLPVAVNTAGEKLSKQTRAVPIDIDRPARALVAAVRFLGQNPPETLDRASLSEIRNWTIAHWDRGRIPPVRQLPSPTEFPK